jgi:predicted RNA-binding protein (virulence factor B family)
MTLQAGEIVTLVCSRETDIGYMLGKEPEEVFLHKNEAVGEVELEQEITVFLYHDSKGRLSATMAMPHITLESYGFAKVVDVLEGSGVFVDIGIQKDILLEKGDLPPIESVWPIEGNEVFCTLKRTNKGRLLIKLATEPVMKKIAIQPEQSMLNKNVSGIIYRTLRVGSYILTDERLIGFIHESQRRTEPRIGERVNGRVIDIKDDGTVNVSLLPRVHEGLDEDASQLYDYLMGRGGAMPYWDKSDAEDIKVRFNMSKGSFKRALGRLMKEDKIYQEEGWTYAKELFQKHNK